MPNPTLPLGSGGSATPSDTVADPAGPFRRFMVATEGDVSAVLASGDTVLFPGCLPGVQYEGFVSHFRVTGTTATGIVGIA